jgi:hypothetical protein
VQKCYEKPDKAVKVTQARVLLCEKFMCMIVYEVIDKVFIPGIKCLVATQCLIATQVCWKKPFTIAW